MDWSKLPLWILFLLMIPTFIGYFTCHVLKLKKNVATTYLFGNMTQWAVLQIIGVPMVLLRTSFTFLTIVYSVILGGLCVAGILLWIRHKNDPKNRIEKKKLEYQDIFALVLMIAGYIALAVMLAIKQHTDHDDSRFVVNAVDIVRTDTMFLTNPATGLPITDFFKQELVRDVFSPNAVYIAYVARMTGTHATIMAHSVLVQSLMLCVLAVYWLLGDTFFKKSVFSKASFVFLAFLTMVYGCYTGYPAQAFTLFRIWQGKAAIAAFGIPAVFLVCSWIYDEPTDWKKCILLYIVILAMCQFSTMGIMLGGAMCGGIGLAYAILKKKPTMALRIWIGFAICLVYFTAYIMSNGGSLYNGETLF